MRSRVGPYLVMAAVVALAGCGSNGHTGTTGGAKEKVSPGVAQGPQIKQVWTEFFSGKTPASTKISLLQNGQKFAAVIQAQSQSPLAAESSARVSAVKLTGPVTAKVTYTVLLAGKPALTNTTGSAVKESGSWKVSDTSFCQLLALQGTTPPACPKG